MLMLIKMEEEGEKDDTQEIRSQGNYSQFCQVLQVLNELST